MDFNQLFWIIMVGLKKFKKIDYNRFKKKDYNDTIFLINNIQL